MNRMICPPELDLARFVDADFSAEAARRIEEHLRQCGICARSVSEYRSAIAALAHAPAVEFDIKAHVEDVMHNLESVPPRKSGIRFDARLAVGALAAAAAMVFWFANAQRSSLEPAFQARGGISAASLVRDVGVQWYTRAQELLPLRAGDVIAPNAEFTARLRNLGQASAFVMLLAIDSRNAVHWITPNYTNARDNPSAVEVARTDSERLLPSSVVFDDLAEGPLRIITVISPAALQVSQVEKLSAVELGSVQLTSHLKGAELREFVVKVERPQPRNTP